MPDAAHIIAGRCTTVFEGTREQEQHGDMILLIKPDGTVLVHDTAGYQPVAWLTRADTVTVASDTITAQNGNQCLRVIVEETHARGSYPTSTAGTPIGDCPHCGGTLVRARGSVSCPECDRHYSLPSQSTVLEEPCPDCSLPQFRVERGRTFEVCLDRDCQSLDERVRSAYDREWGCPDCEGDLRVLRRGGLLLGCENYPDCENGFSFPAGVHGGECDCGLPAFETANGHRCLDSNCELAASESTDEDDTSTGRLAQ